MDKVDEFLSLIDERSQLDRTDSKFFQQLLEHPVGTTTNNGINKLISYISESPKVLLGKLKNNFLFDYFFEKVISDKVMHPTHSLNWQDGFIKIINSLNSVSSEENINIKQDKKYILRLQTTHRSLNKIFKTLLNVGFEMGDPEFLVYSIITRGEFAKLKILAESYVIEDYPGVLDFALRYGRIEIINYLLNNMKLDIRLYGKIIDFENYTDNCRYMYYQEQLSQQDVMHKYNSPITPSKQDYIASLKLILEHYDNDITIKTLEIWCEFIRSKVYEWDIIDSKEVLTLLKAQISAPVPITHDFHEFNSIIIGNEWSDRTYLVGYCLDLDRKLTNLQDRYNILSDRLYKLQEQSREHVREPRIRHNTQ